MVSIKQYNIDNGQVGGLINIFVGSMYVFVPLNFIMMMSIFYKLILGNIISLNLFICLLIPSYILFLWIHFAIIAPSMIKQANRQACAHGNPIIDELGKIREQLNELERFRETNK